MNDEERRKVLSLIGNEDLDALRQGRITQYVIWRATQRAGMRALKLHERLGLSDQLNLMLEAARDPREAAVDAHARKARP